MEREQLTYQWKMCWKPVKAIIRDTSLWSARMLLALIPTFLGVLAAPRRSCYTPNIASSLLSCVMQCFLYNSALEQRHENQSWQSGFQGAPHSEIHRFKICGKKAYWNGIGSQHLQILKLNFSREKQSHQWIIVIISFSFFIVIFWGRWGMYYVCSFISLKSSVGKIL